MAKGYRPKFRRQYGWGTRYDNVNCMMAAAAMALDNQTEGAIQITPPEARKLSGDKLGGTNISDVVTVFNKKGEKGPWAVYGEAWDKFVQRLQHGRGAVVAGVYGKVPPPYNSAPSFHGFHGIYVDRIGPKRALVYDPLAFRARWWPLDVLHDFATALPHNLNHHGSSYPQNSVFAGYTTREDTSPVGPQDPPDDGTDDLPGDDDQPSEQDQKQAIIQALQQLQAETDAAITTIIGQVENL